MFTLATMLLAQGVEDITGFFDCSMGDFHAKITTHGYDPFNAPFPVEAGYRKWVSAQYVLEEAHWSWSSFSSKDARYFIDFRFWDDVTEIKYMKVPADIGEFNQWDNYLTIQGGYFGEDGFACQNI